MYPLKANPHRLLRPRLQRFWASSGGPPEVSGRLLRHCRTFRDSLVSLQLLHVSAENTVDDHGALWVSRCCRHVEGRICGHVRQWTMERARLRQKTLQVMGAWISLVHGRQTQLMISGLDFLLY